MTDDGTFEARSQAIIDRIGDGELVGTVVVDQVYAKYQHENLALQHPHGGGARYLADPLMDNRDTLIQFLADHVLEDGGHEGMIVCMETLSGWVITHAPVWFGDLRQSGHPIVTDGGALIYDRPPVQHRLSEAEIEAKKDLDPSGWVTLHGDHVYIGVGR